MKLLTLNCHAWQEENQAYKIHYLAKIIAANDYDVIALQEVSQHEEGKLLKDGVKEGNYILALLKELKALGITHYDYVWSFCHIGYKSYEEGIGILTKHPIVEKEEFFITKGIDKENWKTRKILRVAVQYSNKLIDVFSCHLGWWEDKDEPFKHQVDVLNSKIPKDRLAFIMGDFNNNANKRGQGYDYMCAKGWIDTYIVADQKDEGITVVGKIAGWEENLETLRIDLIWTNKPITVKKSKVCFNGKETEVVSDHYGVEIEVE